MGRPGEVRVCSSVGQNPGEGLEWINHLIPRVHPSFQFSENGTGFNRRSLEKWRRRPECHSWMSEMDPEIRSGAGIEPKSVISSQWARLAHSAYLSAWDSSGLWKHGLHPKFVWIQNFPGQGLTCFSFSARWFSCSVNIDSHLLKDFLLLLWWPLLPGRIVRPGVFKTETQWCIWLLTELKPLFTNHCLGKSLMKGIGGNNTVNRYSDMIKRVV